MSFAPSSPRDDAERDPPDGAPGPVGDAEHHLAVQLARLLVAPPATAAGLARRFDAPTRRALRDALVDGLGRGALSARLERCLPLLVRLLGLGPHAGRLRALVRRWSTPRNVKRLARLALRYAPDRGGAVRARRTTGRRLSGHPAGSAAPRLRARKHGWYRAVTPRLQGGAGLAHTRLRRTLLAGYPPAGQRGGG